MITSTKLSSNRCDSPATAAEPPRLRVAHVSHGFEVGGAEKLLMEFGRLCDRTRFELSFVALGSDGPIGKQLREAGWPAVALERPDGLSPRLVFRLARYFRRNQIDVVHTHDPRPHVHATVAARLAGVRHVIHTRHCQAAFLSPRQHRLAKMIARWTDRFVCVSQDAARLAVDHGIAAPRVDTIWNGVDLTRFRYCSFDPDAPLVTVARLSPEKDQATLLRAVAIAASRDPAIRLDIAGDGPCRADLERLAVELRIQHCVRFLGNVDDVPALLSHASLFVLSSKTEGIALTILEAQAQGVPVIATHVGGNPEIILDGETGKLVPANDPAALAEAIYDLRQDPQLCNSLARAARARVAEYFDVQKMVQRYESLYVSCIR